MRKNVYPMKIMNPYALLKMEIIKIYFCGVIKINFLNKNFNMKIVSFLKFH